MKRLQLLFITIILSLALFAQTKKTVQALTISTPLTIDGILDEIEMFEITKVASHLYAADRLKRRLVRKIRLAYDLGYSAMNKDAYFYCAKQTGAIGAQIGGLIKSIAENKRK